MSAPDKLSRRARETIDYADTIGICPISCWEISMKVTAGRISLDRDTRAWVRQALHRRGVELLELSADIAVRAGRIDRASFHGDPADRLIVATAVHHGAELISKDARIRKFSGVRSVW